MSVLKNIVAAALCSLLASAHLRGADPDSAGAADAGVSKTPVAAASKTSATPWGVSSSAGAFRDHAEWLPKMAEAGVTTVRLFPEWRGFEPTPGNFNWSQADALLKAAGENKIEINAILMGSPPQSKTAHAFPVDNLADWSRFVAAVVGRYDKQIRYWEVWNEGNGGFNDGHHTTTDYAKLAIATYEAAKKVDPQAQIGLTVASFDAAYLNQTALAMAKAGKPGSFDYLCIHPYEIADGLADVDGEIPYLWMSHLLRQMLAQSAPERKNAEIWITEVGHRVEKKADRQVSDLDAARALAKLYTMAIAQGIARVQWFEARDPQGEDQGFGLLARDGTARASYKSLSNLASVLGPQPRYQGWLALGQGGRGFGFVFAGPTSAENTIGAKSKSDDSKQNSAKTGSKTAASGNAVLVAWMPRGEKDKTLSFERDVQVIDSLSGQATTLRAKEPLELTDSPVYVVGLPAEQVKQAQAHAGKNFPWGGDHSAAKLVSCQPGDPNAGGGVFQVGRAATPAVKFADGSTGILVMGDIGHPVSFYVHPSFASFQTKEYYVRAMVRRVAGGNVGMNLLYEVADTQGRSPYANAEKWFGATAGSEWQTYTWHVTDACFAKMWGYDIVLRPEQSIPFVIGKVEVSTEPFK